jgi:hypothetical protein
LDGLAWTPHGGKPVAQLIQLILSNLASILFVVAVLLALLPRGSQPFSARLLDWMLLLAIGVS